jgi:valyl-tRNA synthetase
MIMMGLHFTRKVPFRAVYLHSLVRTAGGEKMSKSKGTGLDPVVLNQQYGTDAMRFCLASMAAPGTDIVLSEDRLASARNFANKIWNASRFLFVNLEKFEQSGVSLEELAAPEVRAGAPYAADGSVPLVDQWLYSRLAITIETVNEALKNYRFHEAAQNVYQFFWGDFCDWYIEWVKPELQSADRGRAIVAWKNLFAAFDDAQRLLHPFMPFLTEELWHQLPQPFGAKSIALDKFPEPRAKWATDGKDIGMMEQFHSLQEIIVALRNIRAEMKLDPKKKVPAVIFVIDQLRREAIARSRSEIVRLAALTELEISEKPLALRGGGIRSTSDYDVGIRYAAETVDIAAEIARLRKEVEGLEKAIASKEKQLGNEAFCSRAPEKIIRGMEAVLAEQKTELQKLRSRLDELKTAA